ncbi:hypothetical protein [Arundinibacter roseus]|uniref:Uncharacterized protein n=1 Tax=Arundinibacter roseus TaxID=2070510 RepID=A0A4R4K561_9BACT|nr:hypothetical protein [Arundinibacter roseus]TDB61772.1 hypothetical protein EZE20_18670 [Arundinibacter roseus]
MNQTIYLENSTVELAESKIIIQDRIAKNKKITLFLLMPSIIYLGIALFSDPIKSVQALLGLMWVSVFGYRFFKQRNYSVAPEIALSEISQVEFQTNFFGEEYVIIKLTNRQTRELRAIAPAARKLVAFFKEKEIKVLWRSDL